jgi:transcription-repair coupling factor (superfamily II helicase)
MTEKYDVLLKDNDCRKAVWIFRQRNTMIVHRADMFGLTVTIDVG